MSVHHPEALRQQFIRSCASEGIRPRAVPYSPTSFAFARISPSQNIALAHAGWLTSDFAEIEATTLAEALAKAVKGSDHKQCLLIRETGTKDVQWASHVEERPFDRLYVYQIKRKSRARYVYDNHCARAVHDLYPTHICTIDAAMLGVGK